MVALRKPNPPRDPDVITFVYHIRASVYVGRTAQQAIDSLLERNARIRARESVRVERGG